MERRISSNPYTVISVITESIPPNLVLTTKASILLFAGFGDFAGLGCRVLDKLCRVMKPPWDVFRGKSSTRDWGLGYRVRGLGFRV